jgi:CHC2 zinc finger
MPISDTAKWALAYTKIDPLKIATALNEPEQEMWEYLEDLNRELNRYEKERQDYLPTLHKELQEFKEEVPREERKNMRLSHLEHEYKTALSDFEKACIDLAEQKTDDTEKAEQAEKKIKQVTFSTKIVLGYDEGITKDQIEKAREYPIGNLIESKRNMTKCPFHTDKTASMYLKNNFFHCFGCGANGDTIDLLMRRDGLSFKEAVIKLQ